MVPTFETKVQEEIWQFIQALNNTGVNGHPEDLVDFFHENVVFMHPEFGVLGEGREVCVKSYRDFVDQAIIHDFKETDPTIYLYGNTAVATYRFEIAYEIDGETMHDTGRDVFVLVREEERWKVVWRMMTPFSGEG